MATLKQTIANRLNALRSSTGPRTAEGKARSSRNATKHGLSRIGALPPSTLADAIADRKVHWRSDYRPAGPSQEWHFERLCAESVRLDACERRLIAVRAEATERAAESWDDDRAAEVASLASRLADRPEAVQPRLLTSRHGVLWLLERWDEVADSLSRCGGWTPETWALALDLLGVPTAARAGSGPWDLDPEDRSAAPGLELVRLGVDSLRHRLSTYLDARDARAREDAEAGLGPDSSPDIRRLERYAADARRQFARNVAELRRLQSEAARTRPASPIPGVDCPPGPRPDRSALRPRPSAQAPPPEPPSAPAPMPAPTSAAPSPIGPAPIPSPSRPSMPGTSLRERLIDRNAPGNRRSRRAQAAAARRS